MCYPVANQPLWYLLLASELRCSTYCGWAELVSTQEFWRKFSSARARGRRLAGEAGSHLPTQEWRQNNNAKIASPHSIGRC